MASDDFRGNDAGAELAFERELIASAATDRVSDQAVSAAWSRFAVALGATAKLAGTGTTHAPAGARLVAGQSGKLGWISLGALGGGLVTAAFVAMLGGRGGHTERAGAAGPSVTSKIAVPAASVAGTAPVVSSTGPNVSSGAGTGERAEAPPGSERAPQSEASPDRSTPRRAAPAHDQRAILARQRAAGANMSSSLAAEIALLDAARRARDAGEFDHALALLDRYHREHPHGELRRESEVLKVETLVERGDRDEATRLGQQFLDAFPDDPHVAHVRTLAQ